MEYRLSHGKTGKTHPFAVIPERVRRFMLTVFGYSSSCDEVPVPCTSPISSAAAMFASCSSSVFA